MMSKDKVNLKSSIYQTAVTVVGISLWLAAFVQISYAYELQYQITLLALIPLIIIVGMLALKFQLPMGLKFTQEKITFTLSDAIVLLVACWGGILPAVFIAGIEGYTSARRRGSRPSSHLFSSAIMSLDAAAAAVSLMVILRYVFNETELGINHSFFAVAVAFLVASLFQIAANIVLLSTLMALRHGNHLNHLKSFLWAAPMFLPNSAAATLMYFGLQHDFVMIAVVGGPVFLALYFGQRQYRDSVHKRITILEKAHRETIEALAVAINAKDEVTHEHVLRVQIYAAGVARILGCTELEIEALKSGALLHDIGKIAVPDYILNKPGKLTAAEFEKMKLHTIAGAQILSRVEFPYPIVPVVRHHHERWDGKGYPDGLAGETIPLTARILSVVDCFDAVREDRQYRKGLTREEAISLIMEGSGTQYDPRVVGTFIAHLPEYEAEIQANRDTPPPSFGIEPTEQLSESARLVPPAAGLAEEAKSEPSRVGHDEVKALCDLAQVVIGARGQDEVLAAFAEKLEAVVPFDTCAITLIAPESGDTVVAYAAGQNAALLKGRRIAMGEGVTGWVIANRKPFCNTDPKLDFPSNLAIQFDAYRTLAAFPMIRNKQRFGAVTLYSSTLSVYSADQQRLMEESVALITTALSANSEAALPEMRRRFFSDEELGQAPDYPDTDSVKQTITLIESDFKN
ncbi:MAG TPA: HD domain-containing phosphohydrolase [Blastocatellia bacterium]|nr:HD domain-containing phosphohydrolase [Blastocatellia bacterium]